MPTVKSLRLMAKTLGMENFAKLRKTELIRAIQVAEGNAPCFATIGDCGQGDCLFRDDCQEAMMQMAAAG
ncbi:hypothetical protein Deba_2758 [Desulfarculus baarsii DSM 2075]|uniref:Rho termination factor-like N-terminal domain-containing protein n=1 Tax=Desulfarculus baarsii (strain ATCC 33931 / DSM 2075 / LMG 7858 / VKM B-1802 / 2st14) TaxID=644282 RepID=E1QKL9_DESB2|nr:Rho termination factor N-terminal domain-containing protein [Desulfarculus baarsii]ADK86112.1 hypothetical protein Deba_2758 [Desulfarculus baarsii DSM 2075]